MRRAIEARSFFSSLSSLLLLVIGFSFLSSMFVEPDSISARQSITLTTSFLALAAIITVFTAFKWMIERSGPLALCLSLGAFLLLAKQTMGQLHLLTENNGEANANGEITILISFGMVYSYCMYLMTIRLLLLSIWERNVVAGPDVKKSSPTMFVRLLPYKNRHKLPKRQALLVWAVDAIGNLIHGVSIATFSFAVGAFLFTGTMFGALLISGDFESELERLPEYASLVVPVLGFYLIALLVWALCAYAAALLKAKARKLARTSFEQLSMLDTRDPVLFLRHFEDDQVTLPRMREGLRLMRAEPAPRRLDHELVERFSGYGPIVALGKDKKEPLPFGAVRKYVPPKLWKREVLQIAVSAQAIILVAGQSKSIAWEIGHVLDDQSLLFKTLFLMPPRSNENDLLMHPILGPLVSDGKERPKELKCIAAFNNNGHWNTFFSVQMTGDDYVTACRAFFRKDERDKNYSFPTLFAYYATNTVVAVALIFCCFVFPGLTLFRNVTQ